MRRPGFACVRLPSLSLGVEVEAMGTRERVIEWDSSLNAAGFYEAHGYRRQMDGEHRMATGRTTRHGRYGGRRD